MIGAQVLFGDLPEPFLEAALRSVGWVDYVVAVNTAPGTQGGYQNMQAVDRVVPQEKLTMCAMDGALDFAAARNAALAEVPDGDFVLILDADDVHYPEAQDIIGYYLAQGADSITAAFYHFVCYRDAYQDVYPREIVFRKNPDTQFAGRVHEQLITRCHRPVVAEYRYCHYGYLKAQRDVFDRWVRYSEIEGDPNHYAGQDPDHIIEDRVSVAKRFTLPAPPAAAEVLEGYPVCPRPLDGEVESDPPTIGFVLLTRDDADLLPEMLRTLRQTWGQFMVAALDIGSTDDSVALLNEAERLDPVAGFVGLDLHVLGSLPASTSLTEALNTGFRWLREQGCEFIGWIHPDMLFTDPKWLSGLTHELACWPKVGKVCAANTRDGMPAAMIDGHEQCYLMRRQALDEIGLFDERYVGIGGYEDWDMHRRLLNAGWRVVLTPRAPVFHKGMATRSRRDTTAEQVANAEYYERKWGSRDAPV